MGEIRPFLRLAVTVTVALSVLSAGPSASANDMDPVLARMWRYDPTTNQIVARNDLFDALALDLAQGFAPNTLHPAETLGWSGFFMGLEATLTLIDSEAIQWRCGVEGNEGTHGGNMGCNAWDVADGALFVPAVHVRKGLPYSIELGFQIQYMANSELVGIGGEIRFSPFEGYREGWAGYLPDVGVGFTGTYIMGSSELALGLLGVDLSISYPFTISGQFTITPYVGYNFFIIGADHEQVFNSWHVADPEGFEGFCANPTGGTGVPVANCSPYLEFNSGLSRNFGQDLAALTFHRFYVGARILWENLAVTPQFGVTFPGMVGSADGETVTDSAGRQYRNAEARSHFQLSLSVGTDF
jgi:hypothetical protein